MVPSQELAPGSVFGGRYEILEELGKGGMGVVYKAQDQKLRRTVALKFLPFEWTADPQAKERFIREAQAAASLDHPNICTVHEIDEAEGRMFISMAFVEGEDLRKRIGQGPFTVEEPWASACRWPRGSRKPTPRASSTATSRAPTSW